MWSILTIGQDTYVCWNLTAVQRENLGIAMRTRFKLPMYVYAGNPTYQPHEPVWCTAGIANMGARDHVEYV